MWKVSAAGGHERHVADRGAPPVVPSVFGGKNTSVVFGVVTLDVVVVNFYCCCVVRVCGCVEEEGMTAVVVVII